MLMRLKQIGLITLIFVSCTSGVEKYTIEQFDGVNWIHNLAPAKENYIQLEEQYKVGTIDFESDKYTITNVQDLASDANDNLYVLGNKEYQINVFNNEGIFIKSFGRNGQGPEELDYPEFISILDKSIYMLDSKSKIKEWDFNGDYVNQIQIPAKTYQFMKRYKDGFVSLNMNFQPPMQFKMDLIFSSEDFSTQIELMNYNFDMSKNFIIKFGMPISFSSDNHFYMRKEIDSEIIGKYDFDGNPTLFFDRGITKKAFSQEAVDFYNKRFGTMIASGNVPEMPEYPIPIRKTMVDSRDNVWVISGEMNHDREYGEIESTVDVYNNEGIWISTFTTSKISFNSFIKNNRLYSMTGMEEEDGKQFIQCFNIIYN